MANPNPTTAAPIQITGRLVEKPTMAVPAAIMRIAAPMVNRLNILTVLPSTSPPRMPMTCMIDATVPAVLASPIPFRSIYMAMLVLNVATKIPVIRHSAPKYTMLPEMPDLAFSVFGSTSPFGTVSMTIRMIGMQIRNTRYPRFHPAIAVNNPEPFAIRVPPILTKIDWKPITLDFSMPVK